MGSAGGHARSQIWWCPKPIPKKRNFIVDQVDADACRGSVYGHPPNGVGGMKLRGDPCDVVF